MNFPLWLSRRLSIETGGTRTGIIIAVAGVALAVAVMTATLAIVTGFKHEIERKLSGFDAQIWVMPPYNNGEQAQTLASTPQLRQIIRESVPPASDISLSIRQPGILKTDNDFEGVVFIGREDGADFSFERANIVSGTWPDFGADSTVSDIVLSTVQASRLGLDIGSKVYSTFIIDENVKMRRHTVAALYRSDFGEYDRQVVYCSLPLLQSVRNDSANVGDRIEIRGIGEDDIDGYVDALHQNMLSITTYNHYHPVVSIHNYKALYYNWLALLDTNVVVIFILMLAVAGFTLISSLFMLILERVPTIGILRAMGAGNPQIRRVFIYMTLKVVGMGMLAGNLLALTLLLIQQHWKVVPLNPDMYYLSSVPVEIQPLALVALNIGIAVVSYLILVLPASLASKVSPAEAAKYD